MPTQSYRALLGADTLGASRTYLNDTAAALRAHFEGPTEPGASIRVPYMLWLDTANNLLKQRNAANDAWITVLKFGVKYGGLVALDEPNQVFSVDLDMGGKKLKNLALGSGSDAARQSEVDLKAPLAAPALTGDATVNQDPAGPSSIVRRSWAEAQFVKLSGSSMSGRLGVPAAPAAAAGEALRRDEIEQLATFHTSAGHRHTGTDSRKVRYSDLEGLPDLAKINTTFVLSGLDVTDRTGVTVTISSGSAMIQGKEISYAGGSIVLAGSQNGAFVYLLDDASLTVNYSMNFPPVPAILLYEFRTLASSIDRQHDRRMKAPGIILLTDYKGLSGHTDRALGFTPTHVRVKKLTGAGAGTIWDGVADISRALPAVTLDWDAGDVVEIISNGIRASGSTTGNESGEDYMVLAFR